MTIRDLEDLLEDIRVYSDLEAGIHADYWRDMTLITEDELKKLQKLDKNSRGFFVFYFFVATQFFNQVYPLFLLAQNMRVTDAKASINQCSKT